MRQQWRMAFEATEVAAAQRQVQRLLSHQRRSQSWNPTARVALLALRPAWLQNKQMSTKRAHDQRSEFTMSSSESLRLRVANSSYFSVSASLSTLEMTPLFSASSYNFKLCGSCF
jgi:hypothetical protein